MTDLATLRAENEAEFEDVRAQYFAFCSTLTGDPDLSAELVGFLSEELRHILSQGAAAFVLVSLFDLSAAVSLQLRITTKFFCDLGPDSLADVPEGSAQTRTFQLSIPFPNAAMMGQLVAILNEKSRSQLFREVQNKNRQLERATEDALSAAKAKAAFLANMSHELRTPMNAIIGMVNLVLNTELTARQRGYAERIHQSAQNLLAIINDTLDFSKIEAGRMRIDLTQFSIEKLFSDLTTMVADKADSKGLEVIYRIGRDVPEVISGDLLRIGQILINLVNNAVKFTERGEVVVDVAVETQQDGQSALRFEVSDTGIGIDPRFIGKLFRSFEQGDVSMTRRFGGTGLGLVICKQLTEMMGGEIGVQSDFGKGSKFWFTLPLTDDLQIGPAEIPPALHGVQVAVLDDNLTAQGALIEMLGDFGLTARAIEPDADLGAVLQPVKKAARGKAAVPPPRVDVMLIDASLGLETGLDVARRIRALTLERAPKLVLLATISFEIAHAAEIADLFDDCIYKPVLRNAVIQSLQKVLAPSDQADAAQVKAHAGRRETVSQQYAGLRVLVVEDNEINREVAAGIFAQRGIAIELAENGRQSIERATTESWDIVFMDMQRPEMDGVTATQFIRQHDHVKDLPIIALTANATEEDRLRCMRAGMNDFLTKPVDSRELWKMLDRWVAQSKRIGAGIATDRPEDAQALPIQPLAKSVAVDLPDLASINREQLLRNTGGDPVLARSILHSFWQRNQDFGQKCQMALTSGPLSDLERLAHTMKSTAANIGAQPVSDGAAALEAAVKAGADAQHLSGLLAQVSAMLKQVLDDLARVFAGAEKPSASVPGETSKASDSPSDPSAELRALVALLQADDFGVTSAFQALSREALAKLGADQDRLKQAISDFDYETALTILRAHDFA